MKNNKLADPVKNNAQWYLDVIREAQLASHSPVKGCSVIRPYGFAIWELIRDQLDQRIKARGVQNTSFPMLIPESFLSREKSHVEGFAPECATVTHAGGERLAEPMVIRPTSETIIHDSMAQWINSHRDLPMKLNQWGTVFRWEKRPRIFLRNREFHWHEGHTAHATEAEAHKEVHENIKMYHKFAEEVLAVPSICGAKTESEKFAGAVDSYSTEGIFPHGKALQIATIHYLGQNFSKMANVKFVDSDGKHRFVEMTSWGTSTRLLASVILTHGDEKGLILPPAIAPIQVVIIPVGVKGDNCEVYSRVNEVSTELKSQGLRVHVDDRKGMSAGSKFYHWELRGVPLRLEIGPRDVELNSVTCVWRDSVTSHTLDMSEIENIPLMLEGLQIQLLREAKEKLEKNIVTVEDYEDFFRLIKDRSCFIKAFWCGSRDCEAWIKQETKATIRNLPFGQQGQSGKCIYCDKEARNIAYFAKAY